MVIVKESGLFRVRIGTRTHYIEGIRAYQEVVMQKKPVVDISNKKGIDSAKLPKDQSNLLKGMPNLSCHPRVLD